MSRLTLITATLCLLISGTAFGQFGPQPQQPTFQPQQQTYDDGTHNMRFNYPDWVQRHRDGVPGGVRVNQVTGQQSPMIAAAVPFFLSQRTGQFFDLQRTFFYGQQQVAGTNHYLVVQLRDRNNGHIEFYNLVIYQDLEQRVQLRSAESLPVVTRFPPQHPETPGNPSGPTNPPGGNPPWNNGQQGNYRIPNWVNAQPALGGVVRRDTNDGEIRQRANKAVQMINANGQSMQIATLLHAGVQNTQATKTYIVLRDTNNQVWEVVLTEQNNHSHVRWEQL